MKTTLLILSTFWLSFTAFGQAFPEKNLRIPVAKDTLYGTLLQGAKSQNSPLVIFIAGSGPTDRNGNSVAGISAGSYKELAERLAAKGIASFRYDKRGIGESSKNLLSEKDLRFDTYVQDVIDVVTYFQKDFSRIVLLGHSEGALLGAIAAQKTPVKGYISLAGAGMRADSIILKQTENLLPAMRSEIVKGFETLAKGETIPEVSKPLYALFRPDIQPYMISWIRYSPSLEIAKVIVPTLIIQGETDLQVSVEDARMLSRAKPTAKLLLIPNMNHALRTSSRDQAENLATYTNPNGKAPKELVDPIVKFVKKCK